MMSCVGEPAGHPPSCRARAIAKTLDAPASQRCGEATDQARDDANDIP
jgi:hypothetical protein